MTNTKRGIEGIGDAFPPGFGSQLVNLPTYAVRVLQSYWDRLSFDDKCRVRNNLADWNKQKGDKTHFQGKEAVILPDLTQPPEPITPPHPDKKE